MDKMLVSIIMSVLIVGSIVYIPLYQNFNVTGNLSVGQEIFGHINASWVDNMPPGGEDYDPNITDLWNNATYQEIKINENNLWENNTAAYISPKSNMNINISSKNISNINNLLFINYGQIRSFGNANMSILPNESRIKVQEPNFLKIGSNMTMEGLLQLENSAVSHNCDESLKGALYYDTTLNTACLCNSTSWKKMGEDGTC